MYWHLCIGNMPYDLMMIHIRCRTLSCQASQVASALDTPLFSLQLPRKNCFPPHDRQVLSSLFNQQYNCHLLYMQLLCNYLLFVYFIVWLLVLALSSSCFFLFLPLLLFLQQSFIGLLVGSLQGQAYTSNARHNGGGNCTPKGNESKGRALCALRHYKPAAGNKRTLLAMSRSRCGTEPT